VTALLPAWSQRGAALWLLHPPGRALPRRVELLRDFLYRELRDARPPEDAAPTRR
jgi:DNA-binding transcriptional LysR family regulator